MNQQSRNRALRVALALAIVASYSIGLFSAGAAQASSRNDHGGGGGGTVFATISSFDPVSGTLVLITPTGGVITGIVLNGITQIHSGGNCPSTPTTATSSLIPGHGVSQIQFFPGTNQFQSITLSGSGGSGDNERDGGGGQCQGVAQSATISSFDRVSGTLVLITPAGGVVTGIVIRGTTRVLHGQDCHGESNGFGALQPGRGVTQYQLFSGSNVFQSITLAGGGGNGDGGGDGDVRARDGHGDGGHHCHGNGNGNGGDDGDDGDD